MKQLDIDMSPSAFIWKRYLTLTLVTFDLDPVTFDIDLSPPGYICPISSVVHKVALYSCGGERCRSSKPRWTDRQNVMHMSPLYIYIDVLKIGCLPASFNSCLLGLLV